MDKESLKRLKYRSEKITKEFSKERKEEEKKRREEMERDWQDNKPTWYDQDNAANSPLEAGWDGWEEDGYER